jgi:hypothetical protein
VWFFEFRNVAPVAIIGKPIDPNLAFQNYVHLEKKIIIIFFWNNIYIYSWLHIGT